MNPLILVVEDEAPQAEVLSYNLRKEGFDVVVAKDGAEALEKIEEKCPDLLIIDWMLPEYSGVEVCKRLRKNPQSCVLPIIMLTARGEESDRVLGLDSGADDYVVKPYSLKEIIARVRAQLRRAVAGGGNVGEQLLEVEDLTMDLDSHKVKRAGKTIHLSPIEFKLLKTFLEKPGKVYSRNSLLNRVWGTNVYVADRTIDVHIRRLRKALNANGGRDVIRTVRGSGYSIDINK